MVTVETNVITVNERRNTMSENVKNKLCGIGLIALAILCPIFDNGNATVSVLLLPMGIAGLCGKEVEDF